MGRVLGLRTSAESTAVHAGARAGLMPVMFHLLVVAPLRLALLLVAVLSIFYVTMYNWSWLSGDFSNSNPSTLAETLFDLIRSLSDRAGSILGWISLQGGSPPAAPPPEVAIGLGVCALVGRVMLRIPPGAEGSLPPIARSVPTGRPSGRDLDDVRDRRGRRMAAVRAAVVQLDDEWLCYEMDLEEFYLTKPVLRDANVPQTAAYRSALFNLRDLAQSLGEDSTVAQISEAEWAADAALVAWGAANDHALAVGVSDRSPTERAALRRLHALTAQLADPVTPKPMWSSLVEAINREMGKLSTVPVSWEHLVRVPALQQRNPAALDHAVDPVPPEGDSYFGQRRRVNDVEHS